MFLAHIGYAVALTANRNKIVFHLKCSKTGEIKFANVSNLQKNCMGEILIP